MKSDSKDVAETPATAGLGDDGNLKNSDAGQCTASSRWPASVESKSWVVFGRPSDYFMTLPADCASVRGHLVNRSEGPLLLHPDLKQHVCEWQPRDDVVLRLSVSPIGCVHINPVYEPQPDWGRFDGDYAEVVKASETEWVQTESTGLDPYFLYGARSVRHLPPPKWPAETFETLLWVAMAGRIISDPRHPAIQRFMKPKAEWGEPGFEGYCR